MKCTRRYRRYGDEYHCECGVVWGVDEERPPCVVVNDANVGGKVSRKQLGLNKIADIRTRYFKRD